MTNHHTVVVDAQIASIGKDVAYMVFFESGYAIRAVEGAGIIRKEYLNNGKWIRSGKPYIVKSNTNRNAEKIKEMAIRWLA